MASRHGPPQPPFLLSGADAIEAVASTPIWERAALTARVVSRPQEGLIVIGYEVKAERGDEVYEAHCTSVMRRLERVVQHQQAVRPTVSG
jgi:hypothetical protein